MLSSIIVVTFIFLFAVGPVNFLMPQGGIHLFNLLLQPSAQDIAQLKAQAEGGDATAELKLARAYESGVGVTQDDRLATLWYEKAAEQGNAEAQDALGARYLIGQSVQQNKNEAVKWFRQSARQGNANAMYHLGATYYNGDGVGVDFSLSYAWFLLAEEGGNQRAREAVKRAESELKPIAIDRAFEQIAEMYEEGGSLRENHDEAARWWSKAAARGDRDAQVGLALSLVRGSGSPSDISRGRKICNEAAKDHNHRAEYCMGYIFQHGFGVKRDAKKARSWYALAAGKDYVQAIRTLAPMEATGDGGKIDRVGAFLLYAKLAERGDQDALHSLGKLRPQITPKEWQELQEPLRTIRIDPSRLDKVLQRMDAE
jgi:TPR repeat protein